MHLSRTVGDFAATPLPRYETKAEKLHSATTVRRRSKLPGPAPTGPIDPVAEYEPMEGLVISWSGSTTWQNNLAQIARVTRSRRAHVHRRDQRGHAEPAPRTR